MRDSYHNSTCGIVNYHSVAREACPVFYLHSEEKHRPCSAEWIVDNSVLYRGDDIVANPNNMSDFSKNLGDNISINPQAYIGTQTSPMYYYIIHNGRTIDIVYFLMFTYNSGYRVLGKLRGDHEGDIEYVIQRFRIGDDGVPVPVAVYFSAHGDEGRWISSKNVEYSGKRPHVYVALGSHAMYHNAGTQYRVCFLANDKTDRGDIVVGEIIYVTDREPLWMRYRGGWSRDGIDSVATRSWWIRAPTHNSNWFTRLFPLGCINRYFRMRYRFD
jgi:hypothetical protein